VSYQISIASEAEREVRNLPAHVRTIARRQEIRSLGQHPRPPRAKELRDNLGIFRIWLAGRWRIVYAVNDTQQLVTVPRVRLKDDIDYGSLQQGDS
jgi:mRNA-degrading endonuclease RelE of RelBE toxin-antitoxin system